MIDDFGLLYLNAPVGKGQENNPYDVEALDDRLRKIGAYSAPPEYADNPQRYATESMIGALERYQEQNGLKVDGVANPGGPTERAINNRLLEKPRGAGFTIRRPRSPAPSATALKIGAWMSPTCSAASARSTTSPKTRSTTRAASSTKRRRMESKRFSARGAWSTTAGSRQAARPSLRWTMPYPIWRASAGAIGLTLRSVPGVRNKHSQRSFNMASTTSRRPRVAKRESHSPESLRLPGLAQARSRPRSDPSYHPPLRRIGLGRPNRAFLRHAVGYPSAYRFRMTSRRASTTSLARSGCRLTHHLRTRSNALCQYRPGRQSRKSTFQNLGLRSASRSSTAIPTGGRENPTPRSRTKLYRRPSKKHAGKCSRRGPNSNKHPSITMGR